MRKLMRCLWNLPAGLSLLLGLALGALWIRSFWRMDSIAYCDPGKTGYTVGSNCGSILMSCGQRWSHTDYEPKGWFINFHYPAQAGAYAGNIALYQGWTFGRFGYANDRTQRTILPASAVIIMVPHWVAMLPLLVWPMIRFRRYHRQRHRLIHHLCLCCGYDLRATPDRCPECGAIASAQENTGLAARAQ